MITNNFNKYQKYAEEKVFKFSAELEEYELFAYYSEQQFLGKSTMEFWKFYIRKNHSILLYKFVWNYARELKQAATIGGVIHGEPLIAYAKILFSPKDSKEIRALIQNIYSKTTWEEEPIYLDGISRKLKIKEKEYSWNIVSNNPKLKHFHRSIEKIDQSNYDQYAFQLM